MITLVQDQFGEQVASYLSSRINIDIFNIHDFMLNPSVDQKNREELVAVILGKLQSSLLCNFSNLAREHKITWFPLYIDQSNIHIGPRYRPGLPGCFSCLQKRELTYLGIHGLSEAARVIQHSPEKDSNDSQCYIQPMVNMAGEMVMRARSVAGQQECTVKSINILSGETVKGNVIAVHGCECRNPKNGVNAKDRFWRDIEKLHKGLGEEQ